MSLSEKIREKAFVIYELDGTIVEHVLLSDDKLVKLDDVLGLLEGYVAVPRKQLQEKLNRLEQARAGSIFSSHMELGMMYVLRKLLGLDVSEIEAQALKWKKGVMEKYREKLRGDGKRPTK